MAVLSTSFANAILDHINGNGTYTAGTKYLALSTGAQVALDGSLTNEVTGGGYARKTVAFDAASGGVAESTALVDFDVATEDWGEVSHFAICSGSSGSNVLIYGEFATAKTIPAGDSAQVRANEIDVSLG